MKKLNLSFLLTTLLLSSIASAQTLYISDQLTAPIRANAGDNYRIIRMIPAGEEVEQLAKRGAFVQIRFEGNRTGWIHESFLMDEPSARSYIEEAKERFEPILSERDELESTLESLAEQKEALETRAEREKQLLEEEIEHLKEEISKLTEQVVELEQLSAHEIEISRENERLNKLKHTQMVELNTLKQENDRLKANNRSSEWTIGALILFSGILFGSVILPRIANKLRRKRSWDF